MRRATICFVLLSLAACSKDQSPAPADGAAGGSAAQPPATTAPAAPAAPATPTMSEEPAYVTSITGLRREAKDDDKVTDPKTNKPVSNWLATLYRGEQVTALAQDGDWVKVRASDDSEGFMKASDMLLANGVSLGTVIEETKTFARPDFAALNSGKTIQAGTLLFVTKTKDPFSEVNYISSYKTWVSTDKLTTDPNEIEASRLIGKARWLEKKNPASAKDIWDLAKSRFAETKLVQGLAAADAAAEAPAGDAAAPAPAPASTGN